MAERSDDRGATATVCPLVADPANRRVLVDWLESHERYEPTAEPVETAEFDICILDIENLQQEYEALQKRKQETTVIVPYLLLVPNVDGDTLHREFRQRQPELWALIDEIIRMPITYDELADRMDILLQLRTQSEDLDRQRTQLEILNRVLRHDIRNDMAVVLGWIEYLMANVDEELASTLDRISASATHVVELTTVAREISEAMVVNETPELKPVSLTRVLQEVGEKCQETYSNATIELPDAPPEVTVSANELLSSVFRNLITNAIHHNDADDPAVSVRLDETDEHVRVEIADNGPGVPDGIKARIFDDEVKGLESSGTGMGLYLTASLMEMYEGNIRVEDNEPRGAVFVVEFPVAE